MKKIIYLIILNFTFLIFNSPVFAQTPNTYFVSLTGSDTYTGTIDHPFRTVNKALNIVNGGDTIYVRGGTYGPSDAFTISKSGTSTAPITISGYGNERPIFAGNDTGPGDWNAFIWIEGNNIILKQFEFSHSNGRGIGVYGGAVTAIQNITIDNVWIHHTKEAGIYMENANHFTVKNSRVWQTCRVNDKTMSWYVPEMWDAGIMGRNTIGTNGSGVDFKIQNNLIYESYGEGINIHGGMDQVLIENNTVYNTWSVGIYPLNSTHVIIQRNLVYHTDDQRFFDGTAPGRGGIILSDEERPGSANYETVINNIVMGYWVNFGYWYQYKFDVTGLKNTLIANNTFVNAHDSAGYSDGKNNIGWSYANVWIDDSPNHSNVRFINNIVLQEDPQKRNIWVPNNPNFTLSNNLYSTMPYLDYIKKPTDIIADPQLAKTGSTASGQLTAEYFKLLSLSPAIDSGINVDIDHDIEGVTRPQGVGFDLGAYEYRSDTVKTGDANADGNIDSADFQIWYTYYGQTKTGSSYGDFDNNNLVDGKDYTIWLNNFGK
jgi:hypothetical protein